MFTNFLTRSDVRSVQFQPKAQTRSRRRQRRLQRLASLAVAA